MPKKTKENEITNRDILFLVLLIPVSIIVTVSAYKILSKISKTNKKVCTYLGSIWLEGTPSAEDPNPRRGCFTYEEVYAYEE